MNKIRDKQNQPCYTKALLPKKACVSFQDNIHAYTLFARTEERKSEWIEAFSDALDNVQPGLKNQYVHDVEMHTFEQVLFLMFF